VHIHQALRPAVASLFALQIVKRPSLVKIANSDMRNDYKVIKYGRENLWDKRLKLNKILVKAGAFVAINKQIKQELIEEGINSLKITEIPNGIRSDNFKPKNNYAAQDIKKLVYVGRITAHKGIDFLLEALSKIDNVRLDIFGKADNQAYWLMQIKEKGLKEKVNLNGICLDLADKLQDYDIFILPSLMEGISNALLEAMAVGLPCIATNINANLEVISDNPSLIDIADRDLLLEDSAVLVNKGDAGGILKAINFLVQDQGTRERIGKNALLRIRRRFSIQQVVDKYIDLYQQLIDNKI
jgi:glycosyltransferase involved in cell wall biosynthesis